MSFASSTQSLLNKAVLGVRMFKPVPGFHPYQATVAPRLKISPKDPGAASGSNLTLIWLNGKNASMTALYFGPIATVLPTTRVLALSSIRLE
jgi:hypothetical protein